MFIGYCNLAVGGLPDILVDGDGADAVGDDMPASGILDVLYVPANVGVHVAILKDAVARLVEGAVLQHHVVGVAEQLLAREVAVHQPHVPGVPGQVLAVEDAVTDGHVLALPE